jgi:hypothetical protein
MFGIFSTTNKNKAELHNAPKPDDRELFRYNTIRPVLLVVGGCIPRQLTTLDE